MKWSLTWDSRYSLMLDSLTSCANGREEKSWDNSGNLTFRECMQNFWTALWRSYTFATFVSLEVFFIQYCLYGIPRICLKYCLASGQFVVIESCALFQQKQYLITAQNRARCCHNSSAALPTQLRRSPRSQMRENHHRGRQNSDHLLSGKPVHFWPHLRRRDSPQESLVCGWNY